MSSPTETALLALAGVLTIPGMPVPRRNAVLDGVFEDFSALSGAHLGRALVLRDGAIVHSERLGGTPALWNLNHGAEVEWLVSGPDGPEIDAVFDAGLLAIAAALQANPTLGQAGVYAEITSPPDRSVEVAGSRPVKTALLVIELSFTSSNPF